jgi:hypothetical protein
MTSDSLNDGAFRASLPKYRKALARHSNDLKTEDGRLYCFIECYEAAKRQLQADRPIHGGSLETADTEVRRRFEKHFKESGQPQDAVQHIALMLEEIELRVGSAKRAIAAMPLRRAGLSDAKGQEEGGTPAKEFGAGVPGAAPDSLMEKLVGPATSDQVRG